MSYTKTGQKKIILEKSLKKKSFENSLRTKLLLIHYL